MLWLTAGKSRPPKFGVLNNRKQAPIFRRVRFQKEIIVSIRTKLYALIQERADALATMPLATALPGWAVNATRKVWGAGHGTDEFYESPEGFASCFLPEGGGDPVIRVALAGTPEYERVKAAL